MLFPRLRILIFATIVAIPGYALANVVAKIDLSQQEMRVYVDGYWMYTWPVSTARRGYRTPVGRFRPTMLKRMHYSSKYYGSPMPHSIFFLGGYAIHGSYATRSLGRPASHGCVRLHPHNARILYNLIRRHGRHRTRVVIHR